MTAASESAAKGDAVKYITAARMIDCTGADPVADPVIVLKGNRIDKVGTKTSIKIPPGAEVIDCGKCTLLPGLMDIHLHTLMFNCLTFHNYRVAMWEITPELQQMYGLFHAQLVFDMGFTTRARSRHEFAARAVGEGGLRHPRFHRCRASSRGRACRWRPSPSSPARICR